MQLDRATWFGLLELTLTLETMTDQIYLVGGCVRDMLMGLAPKDVDIVTNVDLDLLIPILEDNGWKVNEAGKNFLVLIVSKNNVQFEIALFRQDGTYSDGRRPDFVQIGDINTDQARRDLTINSLYYNALTFEVLDPSGMGLDDLRNKVIRLNGVPSKRIEEDQLRIMRVYRFSNKFGFEIEPKTLKACRTHFNDMCENVSPERIKNEVEKMCNI